MQAAPNGAMEVVNETHSEQVIDLSIDNQVQEQIVQEPPLMDMDLERMNVELYKGRYLMPEDFIDDIRKIVHNASVRVNEDPERLFRAQAMLTAAEVSIQEFDPQFKLECIRMAARERKRRDDFRKEKEKERQPAVQQNGAYAPGTRRSTRNNGNHLEISITDPVLLERRLKRQRSSGVETTPSEDENGERLAKKSRTDGEEAPQSPTTGGRSMSVRFADDVQLPPSSPVLNGEASTSTGAVQERSTSAAPDGVAEVPARRSGFDPALLNPVSPTDARMEIPTDPPDNPFSSPATAEFPTTHIRGPTPQPSAENGTSVSGLPSNAQVILDNDGDQPMASQAPTQEGEAPAPGAEPQPQPEQPMEVERSPTPPPPPFVFDEDMLADLKVYLRDATSSLNVEQLEQLRATCLGIVWRHRTEWDRTSLLRELKDEAREFVEEVSLDDMDAVSP